MATPQRQSQFHRRVPAALLVALSLLTPLATLLANSVAVAATAAANASNTADAASMAANAASGAAPDAPADPSALVSHYRPVDGAPFFLLADSGFTSHDIARVRVEGEPDTFDAYGGVDIVVYRVPKPLDFLKSQKDLHRIQVNGDFAGEGLGNTLSFLWDKWFKKSRMIFQQIFTGDARRSVIGAAPGLKQAAPGSYGTQYRSTPQYRVLKQFELLERFRYPIQQAVPIAPPADTQLAGSSSNFIAPQPGDVYVPLGKLSPGLYFVEAYVGAHRATTLVFVSDTVAISKAAGKSMLVWTADRLSGKPTKDVNILWSDGNGILSSAHSDDDGIASFERAVPEKTYTLGQDPQGGVFVSENFYYDSEIYNSKLYLFTDRPLYKPGDTVKLKVYGRAFTSARESQPIDTARVSVQLLDPAGQLLLSRPLQIDASSGGDGQLGLPANAYPGGYTLRFDYGGASYSAMFRVADYAKPAFDVSIRLDRDDITVGEPVTGQVAVHYLDGAPVKDASVALDLKSQALSATNGDPEFGARFPQKLAQSSLKVDAQGIARFTLPAATVASRYLLQAVAREHNIFAVSANRELILQPGPSTQARKPPASGQPGAVIPRSAAGVLAGAIAMHTDKPRYQAGDVAHVQIVFPEPVDNALLTLERDQVEARTLLGRHDSWLTLTRKSATAWQADIPIKDSYGPNITFSALYIKNGDFSFQNAGIQVVVPAVDITIHTDKTDYRPGDKVTVDLTSSLAGKPVAAVLSAGVVDDMVYTLQPEVAPSIFDFFYHPRRDSVRTTASLNFYGYDLAWSPHASTEAKFDYNQRAFKILTRPRRENIDTAAWQPTLHTDSNGHVNFSFIMPDSLSRWRITARAVTPAGAVGQRTASITSSKPVYLRWSGPTHFRDGDAPHVGLLIFSQQRQPLAATLKVDGVDGTAGAARALTLQPGENFVDLPFTARHDTQLDLSLRTADKLLDRLRVPLIVEAADWTSPQSQLVQTGSALSLPADARDIRLQRASATGAAFGGIIDSLIDYPYGCVEQTASRMIPLTLAIDALPPDAASGPLRQSLEQRLETARGRLMAMAGPKADFAWWGDQTAGDPLLTTYAYYADWRATQRLGIDLPPEHWQHVFDTYQTGVSQLSPLQQALTLWLMQDMHLPVRTLLQGLQTTLQQYGEPAADAAPLDPGTSIVFTRDAPHAQWQMTWLLWRDLVTREHLRAEPGLATRADQAARALQDNADPVLAALAYGLSGQADAPAVAALVNRLDEATPTMERALALIWLQAGAQHAAPNKAPAFEAGTGWRRIASAGGSFWQWRGSAATPLPTGLPPSRPSTPAATMRISYRSAAPQAANLPVTLTRRLYRLAATAKPGVFKAGKALPMLSVNDLYVDELTLTPSDARQTLRYGLLEVPLPGGAQLEAQRFGFEIDGLHALPAAAKPANDDGDTTVSDDNADASGPIDENGNPLLSSAGVLSADKAQDFDSYYAVPITQLKGPLVIRHLIRLGQAGRFVVPAARYYRMYEPSAKAFDTAGTNTWTVQ